MVSIIVPVYKAEKRISQCIESVLSQTYSDFELILVDDGSPDESGAICDLYAWNDDRIRVIHKKNGGASDARNHGLKQAVGEYITFLDSDDTWNVDFLTNAVNKIGQNDLYISGITMVGGKDDCEFVPKVPNEMTVQELYESIFFDIPQICVSGPCCKLFKRSIIVDKKIVFNLTLRCGEDTDFNLSYMQFVKSVYVDNKSYYNYYRGDPNSLFSSYNPQYYSDHVHVYDKWLKLISDVKCSTKAVEIFCQNYHNALIGNIHMAFLHNRSKKEKKEIICILSKDKVIRTKGQIRGRNSIVKFLLRHNFKFSVYLLFSMYYAKNRK